MSIFLATTYEPHFVAATPLSSDIIDDEPTIICTLTDTAAPSIFELSQCKNYKLFKYLEHIVPTEFI